MDNIKVIDPMFWKRQENYQLKRWVKSLPKRKFIADGFLCRIVFDPSVEGGYCVEKLIAIEDVAVTFEQAAKGLNRMAEMLRGSDGKSKKES